MEAVQYTTDDLKVELVLIDKPAVVEPTDVLIRVLISGISRQDLHIIYDLVPCKSEALILGREFCGIVYDIGTEVTMVCKGQKVIVNPNRKCGVCTHCRTGKSQYCTDVSRSIGLYQDGGWAQYVLVPESQVYGIPGTLNLQLAVFTEPMSRVMHGLDLLSPIPIGQSILLAGMGMLGILWAILLHFQGHRNVTVSEPNLARLEIVEKLELEFLYITPQILKENHDCGIYSLYDVIVDCTSSRSALQFHSTLLHKGGKLCIFSAEPNSKSVGISPYHIVKNEITIIGINISTYNYPRALTVLELLANKYIDFDKLCIKTYTLKDYKNAIKHVKKESVIKAVFSMGIQCICRKDVCHI